MSEPFLTVAQVADITGLHPGTIIQEIHEERLAGFYLARQYRVRPADFETWLESKRVKQRSVRSRRAPKAPKTEFGQLAREMARSGRTAKVTHIYEEGGR